MARKRVVSRTMATTIATAMVTNIAEGKVDYETVVLSGSFNDMTKLEKAVRKSIESDPNKRVACVTETHVETALYVMDEQDYLAHATRVEK